MVCGSLTVDDMRFVVALVEIIDALGGGSHNFDVLTAELRARGFPVGNSLGRELDDIEIKLGGPKMCDKLLLDVKRSGSTLLASGRIVAQTCRELLLQLDELHLQVGSDRETLRVGLTNALTINLLPRVLVQSSFLKQFPQVDLEIVEGEPHELGTTLLRRFDFAIGPRDVLTPECAAEPLCRRKRVLLYNRSVKYQRDFSQPMHPSTLRQAIRDEILLVPATRIMPELDSFLLPMSRGHKIVVPQAAVRRNWVERGMGIAVTHEEPGRLVHDDMIGTIDLSATLGETELMFYFRKRHDLSPAAKYLAEAIRVEFSDGRKTGTSS